MNLSDPRVFALACIEARLLGQDKDAEANAKALASIFNRATSKSGETGEKAMCKPGERADLTHCTPKNELSGGTTSTSQEGEEVRARHRRVELPQDTATPGFEPRRPEVKPRPIQNQMDKDAILEQIAKLGMFVMNKGPKVALRRLKQAWASPKVLTKVHHDFTQSQLPKWKGTGDRVLKVAAGLWFMFRCGQKMAYSLWNMAEHSALSISKDRDTTEQSSLRHLLFLQAAKIYKPGTLDLGKVPGFEQIGKLIPTFVPMASLSYLPYIENGPTERLAQANEKVHQALASQQEVKAIPYGESLNPVIEELLRRKDPYFGLLYFTAFDFSKDLVKSLEMAQQARAY